jgi:hypothetical protein
MTIRGEPAFGRVIDFLAFSLLGISTVYDLHDLTTHTYFDCSTYLLTILMTSWKAWTLDTTCCLYIVWRSALRCCILLPLTSWCLTFFRGIGAS